MEAIILLIVVAIIAIVVLTMHLERKRRAALRLRAQQLGLTFSEGDDRGLAARLDLLDPLRAGSNRYVRNVLRGRYRGQPVLVCEHHHETTSTDSKGNRSTTHHWHTVAVVYLPCQCPELTIGREGILSKLAQFAGYEDIDFESHEFSRRFVVRSKDRRFAYDMIHPRVMELLLAHVQFFGSLEIEREICALIRSGKLHPDGLVGDLDLVVALRELMPQHLLEEQARA